MKLGRRRVGTGQPCFIIAEAGVNHDGKVEQALRLIDAARASGADAVKFQTWSTERLLTPTADLAPYQRRNLGRSMSQFEMAKCLELSHAAFRRLKARAEQLGLFFLSTPDEEYSADFLERLGVPAFKLGSGEVTNLPFVRHVARKGRPVILSTGMSTLAEVEAAVRAIEDAGRPPLVLLHCVSDYPTQPRDCNLRAMETLRVAFGYPVGFSDHTMDPAIPPAAVALGACVVEKHLTLDRSLPGPDQAISLTGAEFAAMVRAIRAVEAALGTGRKAPTDTEARTKSAVQKRIVAARPLRRGERLSPQDIALRRASRGLLAGELERVMGRSVRRAVKPNEAIVEALLQ